MASNAPLKSTRLKNRPKKKKVQTLTSVTCKSFRIYAQTLNFGTEELDLLVGSLDRIQIMPSITCVEGYIPLLMCMNSLLNDSHVLKTVVLWRIASIQGGIFFFFLPNREIQFNVIKRDMWFAIKFFAVHNWKYMFFIKQSW